MSAANPPSTPISKSKTAALSRILDLVPRGYGHYVAGTCPASKAVALASKFHRLYGIGCSPAQRLTRRKGGQANATLVMYWPDDATEVAWVLLATKGFGPIWASEKLLPVTDTPRLIWLGYELVRHPTRGGLSWTWKRPKDAMAGWYDLLASQVNQHHHAAAAETLNRAARQPGFAGVREQTWALGAFARSRGYDGELPFLNHVQKVSHGTRLVIPKE